MEWSLADVWGRVLDGDRAAFAVFYSRHADRVYAHCRYRLASAADAEDVTAEVFVIAWARPSKVVFDAQADILPWLLATANRLASGYQRTSSRRRALAARWLRVRPEPDIAVEIVEREELQQQQKQALSVLENLSQHDREVIELCVMQALPASTVAKSLGLSAGTVRSRLSRALVRLRRAYDELDATATQAENPEVTR